MTQYFFKVPFADNGDVTAIPLDAQSGGEVSYDEGFGPDYQAPTSDPDVLFPERPVINELFRALTDAVRIIQSQGFPDWITSAANDGSPYPYSINAIVRHDDTNWLSLINSNTAEPGTDLTKWIPFAFPDAFQTGDMLMWESSTIRSGGWVWANGQTVGNAASGATGRANADTEDLFTLIWNSFPNSVRPIQDSSGSPSTRGANAAADFAANKRLPLRDMRDVVPAGLGTMGGTTDRALLTASNTLGVDGSVFGATGGEQQHTQTTNELPAHVHGAGTFAAGAHNHSVVSGVELGLTGNENTTIYRPTSGGMSLIGRVVSLITGNAAPAISGNSGSAGNGAAFNVVQPTTICNFIIKL